MKMFILPENVYLACLCKCKCKYEKRRQDNEQFQTLKQLWSICIQASFRPGCKESKLMKNEKITNYESLRFALFCFFWNLLCVLGVHLCFQTSNYLEVRMALSWWKDIFQRKFSLTNLPLLTTHTRSSVEWILYLIQLVPCSFSCLE